MRYAADRPLSRELYERYAAEDQETRQIF